jgi:hypothetical protein
MKSSSMGTAHSGSKGAREDLIDRTPAIEDRRDNAKVTASPTDRPKEICIFFGAGSHEVAVGQDDLGLQNLGRFL